MIVTISDVINSIIQSIFFAYIPYYFLKNDNNDKYENKLKVIILSIVLFLEIQVLTIYLGNTVVGSLVMNAINFTTIGLFYKKDYKKAIIIYNFIYFFILINSLVCGSIYLGHLIELIPSDYLNYTTVLFIYCPQFIMEYYIFKNIDKLYSLYKNIIIRKYSLLSTLIITIDINYIIYIIWIESGNSNAIYRDIIAITLVIFILLITTYFANILKKINEISNLNKRLDEKIDELKKVKHDYGAQISYLYGLHLMGRHERLGELLKEIINGNNSILDAVELTSDSDSIISVAMRPAVLKGINVIIEEDVDLDEIIMSELDLQRIISNIVDNSITAMNGKGLITLKSYKSINSVVIKIRNNGPMIEEKIIDKIFNSGFSTKNHADHGFGLAIVKELIEKYNGNINVKSTQEFTEFIIKLPVKEKND